MVDANMELLYFRKKKKSNFLNLLGIKKKEVCVTVQSLQETMALLENSEITCWLYSIINELLSKPLETTKINTDNMSLFEVAHLKIEEKCSRKDLASVRESTHRK